MKLWRFTNPKDYTYARAGRRGTWQGTPARRVPPLVIEWEPDSDRVGDFTWPGFDSDIVITDHVARVLTTAGISGFELAPVEMVGRSDKPWRVQRRPCVQLPYSGPHLWDLWVTGFATTDRERSTVTRIGQDSSGVDDYDLVGVEHVETTWDQQQGQLVRQRHPRVAGQGLYVRSNHGIFRVREALAWIFCTDHVKQLIESHECTNVSFLEMGDVCA
jgi:hypothetical protein